MPHIKAHLNYTQFPPCVKGESTPPLTICNTMLPILDIFIILLFLLFTLFHGLRIAKKDEKPVDYLLGGRALTLPAFVATTVSTWYGGILGVGEYAWQYGISNWIVFCVPYYVGALLFALVISKRARNGESLTIPHRFESHYGKRASICSAILIFLTTVPGAYVLMMGTLCSVSFGLSVTLGIVLTAIFVVIYLWRGGFKAVVKTDALQFALMFGGFIFLTAWLLIGFGLEPLHQLPETHLQISGGQSFASILVWYVIALSTLAEPNFFQRTFAAKTPEIARNGLLISIGCWCVFDMMTTLCGLYARALLPDLQNPVQAFPDLAITVLPTGIIGLFFAGLFATVLSTLDSSLFTAATTIGRDLWPQSIKTSLTNTAKTRIGLIIGAILAAAIAILAGSVIKIWEIFGSVAAASLLIPILGTYYAPFKMSSKGAIVLMILGSLSTLAWFALSQVFDFLPKIRPLFIGAAVAILCFAVDKVISKCKN